jgi:hypothetical protein
MLSPYGLDTIESCPTCKIRADHIFCDLPTTNNLQQALEAIKYGVSQSGCAVCGRAGAPGESSSCVRAA